MSRSLLFYVLFLLINHTLAANVLFLNSASSPSHHIYNRALVVGLANNGHNVTFVSPDVSEKQHPNIHYVHLEKNYEVIYSDVGDGFDLSEYAKLGVWDQILGYHEFLKINCDATLMSDGLESLFSYPKDFKFDVVIHDFTFGPCLLPLVHRFNYPPLIAITAFSSPPYTTITVGGHKYPAYIPHYLLNFPTDMSFAQRIFNTALYAFDSM